MRSHGVRESASGLRQQLLPGKLFNQKYCILSGAYEAKLKQARYYVNPSPACWEKTGLSWAGPGLPRCAR